MEIASPAIQGAKISISKISKISISMTAGPGTESSCASIGDYAIIGDCRTAALISNQGAIDWLCLPHFSSPSLFGALLDEERGGRFLIAPADSARVTRRYLPGSNVLETTFSTPDGVVRTTDLMPVPCGPSLQPMREVLRRIEGVEGAVPVRIEIAPRPDYGRRPPRLERRDKRTWACTWNNECAHVASDVSLVADGDRLIGERIIVGGERLWCSLAYAKGDVGVLPALGAAAQQRLDSTADWWRAWSARTQYAGPYRECVLRSALTLKLMVHALSGAVIAAPSTSLPETLGGERNWDYRYCWLRDAALTMRALIGLGHFDEARGFFNWMLHATRLTWPELQVLYDVYGRTDLPEMELQHWRGFCESRPVRIGNGAHSQLQLDVYGAVCGAAREYFDATGAIARDEARLLRGFGEAVCRQWELPDHGLWEIRGEPRHYTFSKFMCWSALDALLALAGKGVLKAPRRFEPTRRALREVLETRGYNSRIASYVGVLDGAEVDASLLLMGCLDYLHPREARMRSTFARIQERLSRNGLLLRYEAGHDRVAGDEGAFGICSFWAIDNLAKRGDHAEACAHFERLVGLANDLGLYAEEIDPHTGAPLGNFPQAYTHVGLINAALALSSQDR
jgi:GH15 family glucan-1,4-alpha-glucosidase